MDAKYVIVLFKNKVKYKIIKKYQTFNNAINFYNNKVKESNEVIFPVKIENGKESLYEIILMEKTKNKINPIVKTDELGRNITLNLDNPEYSILKINDYNISEKIFSIDKKIKLDSKKVINDILKGENFKLVSKLNNKIIIQDDDKIRLYSLKSNSDSYRFLESLRTHLIQTDKNTCLVVPDSSIEQKKYLYEILVNLGYDKKMLYRTSTTHLKDK
jgi:hypothetical protein